MAKKEIDYDQLLSARHYKHNYTPPDEQILLKIKGNTIGTAGNFIVFSGLPKAGKSTFIHAMLASNSVPYTKQIFGISLDAPANKPFIGYFDTESAEFDFYRNLQRIQTFTGEPMMPPHLNAFTTRQDSAELNKILIETYIKNYPVSVVVVDGLLDLIKNYNDEIESRQLIDWLKAITAIHGTLIIGVIHTGKKDNHTLGHFGSMADRYAQSVLEIVKDRETATLQLHPKYLRSSSDFEPIALMWNGREYVEVPYKENTPSRSQRR